jgi:ribonuclease D
MSDPKVTKIFHFARFDVVILKKYLGVDINSVYCTKIASRLIRTYTDHHGLKHVTKELLKIDLSKEQQSSDWAAEDLSDDQLKYAAMDVLNLHALKERLDIMLTRENRMELAQSCFDFLSTRGQLDAMGWGDMDIFAH